MASGNYVYICVESFYSPHFNILNLLQNKINSINVHVKWKEVQDINIDCLKIMNFYLQLPTYLSLSSHSTPIYPSPPTSPLSILLL